MKVEFNLNGRTCDFDVTPGEFLLDTLRSHHIIRSRRAATKRLAAVYRLDGRHPVYHALY
jgi:aerobic-type carbon monoxide dehydrogenase small subunit (CoxS/CutS family)